MNYEGLDADDQATVFDAYEADESLVAEWFEGMEEAEQYDVLGKKEPMQFGHEEKWYVQDWERFADPDQFELVLVDEAESMAFKVTMPYDAKKMGYDPDGIDDYLTSGHVFDDINRYLKAFTATAVPCDMPAE
jgi:hypothetical protein